MSYLIIIITILCLYTFNKNKEIYSNKKPHQIAILLILKFWYLFVALILMIYIIYFHFPEPTVENKSIVKPSIDVLYCGFKTLTIVNGQITQIIHEDGTVHQGVNVANNWSYDGRSIKHIKGEVIACGNEAKTRDEVIKELSSRFKVKPEINGMDQQEGELMAQYTLEMMKKDPACFLVSDASKSTSREGMFYIDCNDQDKNKHRYWISAENLYNQNLVESVQSVSDQDAISICNDALKSNVIYSATYSPSLNTGSSNKSIESNGRNIVDIEFSAKNEIGSTIDFSGRCILENGNVIEVTANPK